MKQKKIKDNNILHPLRGKIKVYDFISFDTETYDNDNKFYICGIFDENKKRGFDKSNYICYLKKEEAINYLLDTNNKGIRVCTNLDFDLNVLFYETEYFDKFDRVFVGSNCISASIKIGNFKIKFIDAFNFGHFSVKQQGNIIKDFKGKTPFCLGKLPESLNQLEELINYNMQDCIVTYKFIKFIQKGFNELGGNLKGTLGSVSMDIFRRCFLKQNLIKEDTKDKRINELVYFSYYGGRCEIFKRGLIENIFVYDFNSLYPSVMRNKFPNPNSVNYIEFDKNLLDENSTAWSSPKILNINYILEYDGVSEVFINCPNINIPLLPVKDKKLIFPTGLFRGVYTHIELRKALQLGYKIIKIYRTVYYTESIYLFKEFVDKLYEQRLKYKKENSEMNIIPKLISNSLYGKFGQHYIEKMLILNKEENVSYPNDYTIGEKYVYKVIKEICNESHVFPIFATYTTAYARLKLYEYLEKTDCYYCDTDSLFTKEIINTSDKLGDLKLEQTIKSGILIKPKLYLIINSDNKQIVKSKGLPHMNRIDFINMIDGKEYKYKGITKLKESIRNDINPNTWKDLIKSVDINDNKRKWKNKFDKNVLDANSTAWRIELIPND